MTLAELQLIVYFINMAIKYNLYDDLNSILTTINVKFINTKILITIIRVTFPIRDKLPNWNLLKTRIKEEFIRRNESLTKLKGL